MTRKLKVHENKNGELKCRDCKQWLHKSKFNRDRRTRRGYQYRCKICRYKYLKERYKTHPNEKPMYYVQPINFKKREHATIKKIAKDKNLPMREVAIIAVKAMFPTYFYEEG